ncbi:hypothetical protein MRS76_11290 [Rhizobiaceae bacterium n13]|uniref:LPD29 domain-containing protein n=1 Tax=Ferirhizobium litorale TaxID=2927786 RepID=UPI0024B2AF85|nr:LPD29 domain-containing protein [Fererhizobium litorale]MDI7862545.1 hypothetical protein [Fererhizobium litorale]
MTRYLSCAETAKLIRNQLKAKFPGVKFSVRSDVYAGGASIRVNWIDGPTVALVDDIVKPFAGSGFDGMIDMKFGKTAFLLPDGSATLAQISGTEGSGGVYSSAKHFKPCVEAERVSFGADHVFTDRRTSRRLVDGALLSFRRRWGDEMADRIRVGDERDGCCYASADDWETQRRFYEVLSRRVIAA